MTAAAGSTTPTNESMAANGSTLSTTGLRAPADEFTVAIVVPRYLVAGGSPAAVGAQVRTQSGPAPDGTVVRFSGTLGVSFSPDVASTTAGAVSVTAFPGRESGFAQLDAATGSGAGRATVWVRPGPARNVRLGFAPPQAEPGSRVSLVATLTDGYGNPAEGDALEWSAEGATLAQMRSYVERGTAVNTVTAGAGPRAVVAVTTGSSSAQAVIPIEGGARPGRVFLPWAGSATHGCANVLGNSTFGLDRNADSVPDAWSVLPGPGAIARVRAVGRTGWAVRMTDPGSGQAASLTQRVRLPTETSSSAVRLWLRGDEGATVRLDVWSMADVGGRITWAPFLVETLQTSADWALHTLALPLAPHQEVEVGLSLRGPQSVEVTGVELEACPKDTRGADDEPE